jgi:nucleotide-binding universal stress UspA family protein
MYTSILVPLDGSPLGERALTYAMPLAEQHGARLILMHVHEPVVPLTVGGTIPMTDPTLGETWREEQRKYLDRVTKRTRRKTKAPVESVFRDGKVVRTIADYVRTEQVGLVVLCTHGRGGFERLWLGSVADGLLRHLPSPALLVRGGRAAPKVDPSEPLFPRIMVALDGSDAAERALDAALELVGDAPADIRLASVVHPALSMTAQDLPSRFERELTEGYLDPLCARHKSTARTVTYQTAVHANVGRAITQLAKTYDASLIALATQGLGGLQRWLMGSVADKLIRTSPVPVLVCALPPTDAA